MIPQSISNLKLSVRSSGSDNLFIYYYLSYPNSNFDFEFGMWDEGQTHIINIHHHSQFQIWFGSWWMGDDIKKNIIIINSLIWDQPTNHQWMDMNGLTVESQSSVHECCACSHIRSRLFLLSHIHGWWRIQEWEDVAHSLSFIVTPILHPYVWSNTGVKWNEARVWDHPTIIPSLMFPFVHSWMDGDMSDEWMMLTHAHSRSRTPTSFTHS